MGPPSRRSRRTTPAATTSEAGMAAHPPTPWAELQGRLEALVREKPELVVALKELQGALSSYQLEARERGDPGINLESAFESAAREVIRYRQLFDSAPDVYLLTDFKGNIQDANATAVRVLQVRREFLLDKPLTFLVAAGDRTAFLSLLTRLNRDEGLAMRLELRLQPRRADPVDGDVMVGVIGDGAG